MRHCFKFNTFGLFPFDSVALTYAAPSPVAEVHMQAKNSPSLMRDIQIQEQSTFFLTFQAHLQSKECYNILEAS